MKSLAGLLLCASLASAADIGVIEEIVAKVNGDIIPRSELEKSRRELEAELRKQGLTGTQLGPVLKEREKDLLRERIDQILLVSRAKELNINVDTELSKFMSDLQLQSKIADPEKFQQMVRQETGESYEDFKAERKNGMLTQHVIRQEVVSKITIPKSDTEKYYNEHKTEFMREERVYLREILVSTEGKDEAGMAAAEKKAKDLVVRARKGEKFAEMARDNSDSATAHEGGALDNAGYKKGDLVKTVEDAIWSQARGYVTDPVRGQDGFHIIKVEEHSVAGQATLEQAEGQIQEMLYPPLVTPKLREYLTKLRKDAFLEIRTGYVDTGAALGKDTAWTDPAQLKPETVTKAEVGNRTRHKRLLWMIPIPGTETSVKSKSSSSK